MTKMLCVVVMDFKGTVMNMRGWIAAEEEAVMVDQLLATINVSEHGDVLFHAFFFNVEKVGGGDIEVGGVEVDHFLQLLDT